MENKVTTDKFATKEFSNISGKVRNAQVQLLYKQTKTGLIGVFIVAIISCAIFWEVIPNWKLSLWMGIMLLTILVRASILFTFQKRVALISNIDRWATFHVIGVIISGLMWALPLLFLWPSENPEYQLIWPIVILPLSASVVATYYSWRGSYISFLILTALPISLRFFFEGGTLFNILGFLCLFFIVILLRAGKVMYTASLNSFKVSIRNETLNQNLKVEITKRELLNTKLQQEIAERKLAANEIRKFSKVFLDGTNPIFIEDLNGNILETNNEAINVYGFSREELVNKSIMLVVPDKNHKKMDEFIKLCVEGKLVRDVESIRRKKNGIEIPVLMTLSLLTDEKNKPFAIASIASDITKQKNIEKELTKSKAAAERMNATKDKFFKIISHDLRSPFNSIIGFSDLLNNQYDSFEDLERKEFIQKINESSLYAFGLLENLLNWARTQTDEIRINKENLNLRNLVNTSIYPYLSNVGSKNISIINNIEPQMMILIDKNTALTFIRNIVSNAIKFTNKGGSITIDSYLNEASIDLHITDTGVGMSPEVLSTLFQIEKNVSTKGTNDEKGTGLGLLLCKEFVEMNGGSISAKSEVNKGSEFIISLPL